jgi:hypothetical protein
MIGGWCRECALGDLPVIGLESNNMLDQAFHVLKTGGVANWGTDVPTLPRIGHKSIGRVMLQAMIHCAHRT